MKAIENSIVKKFIKICGKDYVLIHDLEGYGKDETEDLLFLPQIVLRPSNTIEVSEIVRICNEHKLSITPRGAGTGLSGGALPINGGVVLVLDRFNKIIAIDEENFQVTVEPGVINANLQMAVEEKGLFYPPDPASYGSCFLGGNIAHNSGGPKALKYGVTKDYVLNLEVVLPNGEIIWTGANTLKNSTGYNLTQLFVGSEGTLGIVTKIVFKLLPKPKYDVLIWVSFSCIADACAVVSKTFKAGFSPSAMELMEKLAVEMSVKSLNIQFPFNKNEKAYLLIELDGNNLQQLEKEMEEMAMLLYDNKAIEIYPATTSEEKERLWKIRRITGEAVKQGNIYKEEDTVVPRASMPQLMNKVKQIGEKYDFRTVCYGHAGDGNVHVNILKDDMNEQKWTQTIPKAIVEIFEECKRLHGTISGEHGIGYVQKPFLNIVLTNSHIELMKSIKTAFDPNGIMNPGKIF